MTDLDVVWASLDERVESGWAPGIVGGVFADGMAQVYATGVLAFDSDDAMTPETRFRIASLGKPIAGVLGAMLVGDGVLALDEPVSTWMPELANPRVLRHPTAALDDTVDAVRPITVRHLLTATNGLGFSFDDTTVGPALHEFATGPFPPPFTPDEYLARIAAIPLAWQPGERWSYHTSADLLSVLLSRASGLPLHDLLRQRILAPLGMRSTGFSASGETLPIEYRGTENGIEVFEEYTTAFDHPPLFESLGGGLVSTVPDYLAFLCALYEGELLPPELLRELTTGQLTDEQRSTAGMMLGPGVSWGWQVSVDETGRYGWDGGAGTSGYVDPSRGLVGVVMSQRFVSGPQDGSEYFWDPLTA
jgi:CubicO group peptidase (beta-lactamase class C family)